MLACLQHRAAAGWRCTQCQRPLCPACAAPSPGLVVCTYCGGLADVLRERRAVLRPFRGEIATAVRWPFPRAGVLSCAAAAVVVWLLGALGGLAGLIADGVMLAYLFQIVRHTARGADDFPAPEDFRGFFEDVLSPLFRILLATVWMFGPAMWWAFYKAGGDLGRFLSSDVLAARSAPFLALLAAGAFFFPMALVAASLRGPISQVLNPALVVGNAVRFRGDYLVLAAFCLACSIAEALLNAICGFVFARFPFPELWRDFVLLFVPLAMFRALGLFVRTFGDRLGYGMASDYLEPVLGPAQPRGNVPPPRQAARPVLPDAIDITDPPPSGRIR
ncbi:MAG: hypothetical protein ACJ78Z_14765 [Myxococcales bacterium]